MQTHQKGTKINKLFFSGILPPDFREVHTYKDKDIYTTVIKGKYLDELNWQKLVTNINNKLNVVEIYSIESNGSHFNVYHK